MSEAVLSDKVLADAAEDTGAPLPEEVGLSAEKFERWATSILAPLIGLNFCLLACVRLGRLSGYSTDAGIGSLLLGAVAIGLVYRRAGERIYANYIAVGLAAGLLSIALLLPAAAPFAAILAVGVLFEAVRRERVHGRSFALFACWLLPLLDQAKLAPSTLYATLLLCAPAVLLVRRKLFGVALVVVGVILGQAGLEQLRNGNGGFVAVIISLAALALSMVYEMAVPIREFSTFRLLLGQLPVVAAFALAIGAALPHGLPVRSIVWVMAGVITFYELLRTYSERASVPARLTWVGLALGGAALAEFNLVSNFAIACQLVVVAAGLHVAGAALEASILSDFGVAFLAAVVGWLFSVNGTNLAVVITSAVTGVALVLASERVRTAAPLPWWSGFLQKRHANFLKRLATGALKRLGDLALFKLLFGWFSVGLVWVRFVLKAASKSDIRPLVNLSGHAWLALWVGPRLVEQLAALLPAREIHLEPMLAALFANAYGALLFAGGIKSERRFTRLLGLALVLAPGVVRLVTSRSMPVDELSSLLFTTGSGLAAIGLMARQQHALRAVALPRI